MGDDQKSRPPRMHYTRNEKLLLAFCSHTGVDPASLASLFEHERLPSSLRRRVRHPKEYELTSAEEVAVVLKLAQLCGVAPNKKKKHL